MKPAALAWEVIASDDEECLERVGVPGGWLYRTRRAGLISSPAFVPSGSASVPATPHDALFEAATKSS